MKNDLVATYYANAMALLASERRKAARNESGKVVYVDQVYRILARHNVHAGLEDFLSNPFVSTAMKILKYFQSNYKVRQALSLLEEAASETKKRRK